VGAVSVVVAGWLGDRLGPNGRPLLLFAGLTATAFTLFALMMIHRGTSDAVPIALVGLIGFCLLGPYAYLGGAMALDFGGKAAGAVASGIIDGVGYIGAVSAGVGGAKVAVAFGWTGVFATLAVVGMMGAIGAGMLYFIGLRAAAPERVAGAEAGSLRRREGARP